MPAIKMEQFGGMLPAWDDHLLPNGQAALSINGYLFSGALTGWRTPKLLRALNNSAAKFAYRVPKVTKGTASNTLTIVSNPQQNDAVTIGEFTYIFQPDVSGLTVPYTVLIGATPTDTATNFLAALTLDQGQNLNQGVLYGTGTGPNPDVDQFGNCTATGNTVYVQAADIGEAYNNTATTETTGGSRLSWPSTTMTGGANSSFDPSITATAYWLEFLDHDTTVIRSPIVDDQYDRYYFASPSLPPQYNTYDRIAAGQSTWLLGVNPPGCAPIVTVEGGSDQAQLGLPTSSSSNVYNPGANVLFVQPITPSGGMELNDISIMASAGVAQTSIGSYVGVVYADNNGAPGALIAVGATATGEAPSTAVVSTFANPVPLTDKTQYWIGMFSFYSLAQFALADDASTAGGQYMAATFDNGPPQEFVTLGGIPDVQMWADLTTASVIEARSYLYTWVTSYGEESPPSPTDLVNGWSNGSWTIETWAPPPEDMGVDRDIKTIRIYRTVPGTSGQTVFYWVADIDIASNTISAMTTASGVLNGTAVISGPGQITETFGDDQVALNFQLPSTNWFPPPVGLQGMYSMPNGMIVGFRGNEIWFCEPYYPHAWPPAYVITTEFPIVGLGVSGMAVVACTGGTPYVATGVNPGTMSLVKLPNQEPCTSRGAILGNNNGVYYPSPRGLILVMPASGTAANTTELWITPDKWTQFTPQKNLEAVLQSSCYFAFGRTEGADNSQAQRGFTIELNTGDSASFTIWPQPGGHRVGFSQLTAPNAVDIDNMMNDPWTGITMLLQGGNVYYYDFTDPAPLIQPYTWKSKIYQMKNKEDFSAMRVFFTVPPNTPVQNTTRNTADTDDPSWNTLQTGQYGIVYVYGDGNLVTTRELVSNGELLRIASGQKYEQWQWEIKARVLISNIQAAPTVKELRNV